MRSRDNGSDVPMSWMTWMSWNGASTTLCISSRALLMISMILSFLLSIQHWLCVCMCWLNTLSASNSLSIKNNSTNRTSLSSRRMECPAMVSVSSSIPTDFSISYHSCSRTYRSFYDLHQWPWARYTLHNILLLGFPFYPLPSLYCPTRILCHLFGLVDLHSSSLILAWILCHPCPHPHPVSCVPPTPVYNPPVGRYKQTISTQCAGSPRTRLNTRTSRYSLPSTGDLCTVFSKPGDTFLVLPGRRNATACPAWRRLGLPCAALPGQARRTQTHALGR